MATGLHRRARSRSDHPQLARSGRSSRRRDDGRYRAQAVREDACVACRDRGVLRRRDRQQDLGRPDPLVEPRCRAAVRLHGERSDRPRHPHHHSSRKLEEEKQILERLRLRGAHRALRDCPRHEVRAASRHLFDRLAAVGRRPGRRRVEGCPRHHGCANASRRTCAARTRGCSSSGKPRPCCSRRKSRTRCYAASSTRSRRISSSTRT